MIAVKDLTIETGDFCLKNISFSIPTGVYAILMGRTGTGKTSLLEALCGLRPIRSGQIMLEGRDVTDLRPAERGIGYLPQDVALFGHMTVRENIVFALSIRNVSKQIIESRLTQLAGMLGLESLLSRSTGDLSGGEKQRVALGRALAANPSILCLDEPLSALDEETHGELVSLLKNIQEKEGITVLHVTHNRSESIALGNFHLFLRDGTVSTV
jgi:ABC-type sugar transport system ATPase subunit